MLGIAEALGMLLAGFILFVLGLSAGYSAGVRVGYRKAMNRVHEAIERGKTKPDDPAQ